MVTGIFSDSARATEVSLVTITTWVLLKTVLVFAIQCKRWNMVESHIPDTPTLQHPLCPKASTTIWSTYYAPGSIHLVLDSALIGTGLVPGPTPLSVLWTCPYCMFVTPSVGAGAQCYTRPRYDWAPSGLKQAISSYPSHLQCWILILTCITGLI